MISKKLLCYSAPCAKNRLNSGLMDEKDYNLYMSALRGEGDFPPEKFRKYFSGVCENLNPEKATDNEIRDYFFGQHNERSMEYCHVIECEVVRLAKEKAVVRRFDNKKELKAFIYTEKPKRGERVVFHIDGIVDILD